MASLVIFSVEVGRLAEFYEAVLGMAPLGELSADIRLRSESEEILLHSVSAALAETIHVSVPPEPRVSSAIKPVFDVASLDDALEAVRLHGGVVTKHSFVLEGLARHEVLDPDGNVIQLRSRLF